MKKTIAILLLLLLLAGCQKVNTDAAQAPTPAPTAEPEPAPTEEPPAEAAETEAPQAEAAPAQYAFTFSAKTLEGEKVTQEFFGQYDLTMVNVWASWCGPCCKELPDLSELYKILPENVGFLSVTIDDPEDLKAAQDILAENGCTFPCLDGQASAGLTENVLSGVMAIPTTLFFDRSGNQVGTSILGAPQGGDSVSDAYLQQIQNRLDQLNGK